MTIKDISTPKMVKVVLVLVVVVVVVVVKKGKLISNFRIFKESPLSRLKLKNFQVYFDVIFCSYFYFGKFLPWSSILKLLRYSLSL